MALTPEELDRRVKAAAALYGLKKGEVRKVLHDYGTDATLAEALASGRKAIQDRAIRDLAEALGMPRAWFTEPDWRKLIRDAPATGTDLAERAKRRADRALGTGRSKSQGTLPATHRTPGDA